jgi:phosphotransferase system  glucose/maltose/N-acetylglucosamine-specific IIC component
MAAFLEWLSYAIMIALPLLFFLGMIVRASDALTKIEVRLKESTEQLKEIGNELARREVH